MDLGFGLSLEQKQKIFLTPELRQAIGVLQLSVAELAAYVENEVQENPLLEIVPRTENHGEVLKGYDNHEKNFTLENTLWKEPSLFEHLLSQLNLELIEAEDQRIAEYILGNLDQSGYLRIELATIEKVFQCSAEKVFEVLNLVQSFEPPGVGARNLRECLLLQLKAKNICNENLANLILFHLEDLGEGRLTPIIKNLNITEKEVKDYFRIIRNLNPRPGASFHQGGKNIYAIPDVTVHQRGEEFHILVNERDVPILEVNSAYQFMLNSEAVANSDTKLYLHEKWKAACWLVKSIEQRRSTIYRIVNEIIEVQKEYFYNPKIELKTLNYKEIAAALEISESTVSRVVANKWIDIPHGLFPLRYFFQNRTVNLKSTASTQSVQQAIQDIVKNEDKNKPLSDQKIAEQLEQRGYVVSRRTINKYRIELGIPAANKRRILD